MGNNDKRPKIRFKGFNDDWEQHKVSEITNFHKQGFYTTESYNDEKKYYLLRGTDLTENKLILKDTPKINATEKDYQAFKAQIGDFLIVRSGTVGTYGIVYEDIPAIFGSYLIDFRFNKNQVINEFFGYFYQSDLFKNQLKMIIQQSANTNINAENIKSTFIKLPSLAEQKKISDYFQNIDHLISLHQRKLEKLGNIKKSMLEKMFPKDENKVPEIRFKGFNDDWEQHKVSKEVYSVDTGKSKYNILEIGKYEILGSTGIIGYDDSYDYEGDFLLTARVGANAGTLYRHSGKVKITDNTVFLQGNHIDFVFYLLDKFDLKKLSFGSGQPLIKASELKAIELYIPKNSEEKNKITKYFISIDKLISLHQRKLEKLKNIKKACLEKMFV
ncbi:restriction endonuclease subunit S [Peptacetobacter hiranonis]|uniref:restriction endonuclease subunit S n=1 Tax=Peptacetobacter hiranonis TaxID=89152 RepID=UPI002E79117C|nr:restriction endonuclease subunit S [Peptacetobacter hiranonis]MEE0249066.1 restriction endonuclease subunit S [Peptacetobacter hiranonis]